MKVAIYARVSDSGYENKEEAERKKKQDTDNQLFPLRDFVTNRGWVIYKEYVDEISAVKKRPKFDEMMQAAYEGKFQAIVTIKLDRFARSVRDFVNFLQTLQGYNVRFIATSQGIDTKENNSASMFLVHMLAAVAELERGIISERVKAGLARKKLKGGRIGRKPILIDAALITERIRAGDSYKNICAEFKIKKSALYKKLQAYNRRAI
jgi:DNA invertase Pin-like site-specific DNA recombinase